jgi:hypothetical protein
MKFLFKSFLIFFILLQSCNHLDKSQQNNKTQKNEQELSVEYFESLPNPPDPPILRSYRNVHILVKCHKCGKVHKPSDVSN